MGGTGNPRNTVIVVNLTVIVQIIKCLCSHSATSRLLPKGSYVVAYLYRNMKKVHFCKIKQSFDLFNTVRVTVGLTPLVSIFKYETVILLDCVAGVAKLWHVSKYEAFV